MSVSFVGVVGGDSFSSPMSIGFSTFTVSCLVVFTLNACFKPFLYFSSSLHTPIAQKGSALCARLSLRKLR